jgi:hypothetical protein
VHLFVIAAIPYQNYNFSVEGHPAFFQDFSNNVQLDARHSRTLNNNPFHCQLGNLDRVFSGIYNLGEERGGTVKVFLFTLK